MTFLQVTWYSSWKSRNISGTFRCKLGLKDEVIFCIWISIVGQAFLQAAVAYVMRLATASLDDSATLN